MTYLKWWLKNWLKLATKFALSTIKLIHFSVQAPFVQPNFLPINCFRISFHRKNFQDNDQLSYCYFTCFKSSGRALTQSWLDTLFLSHSLNDTNQKKIVFRIFLLFKHYKITALSKNEMQVFTKWQHTQRKI